MDDFLNQICVRITLKNDEEVLSQGSGFLFKGERAFFVITAYHCIYGNDDKFIGVPKEYICIEWQESFNSKFSPYLVVNVIASNKNDDWAILEVDYVDIKSTFPAYSLTSDFEINMDVNFRGFQNDDKNAGRTFGSRVLEKSSNNEFKITLNPGENFKTGSDEAQGLSGSGAFITMDGKLYLLGLLKSVRGEDALNNDIKCCPISAMNSFLGVELVKMGISSDFDKIADDEFKNIIRSDARDISDKMKDVCPDIPTYRLGKYSRDLALGKVELQRFSEREMSAVKFRIFEACQEELMFFVEHREMDTVTIDEINELIIKYTEKASAIITTKSVIYRYPKFDNDLLRRIILDLINECFLSFDKAGIYEE